VFSASQRAFLAPTQLHSAPSPPAAQAKNAVIYCGAPLYAIGWYCADYREKEKLHHRY
jgi:hypothetical protein